MRVPFSLCVYFTLLHYNFSYFELFFTCFCCYSIHTNVFNKYFCGLYVLASSKQFDNSIRIKVFFCFVFQKKKCENPRGSLVT